MMNEVLPANLAKEREGKTFVKDLLYPGLEWERIVNSKNRPESERSEGLSIQ